MKKGKRVAVVACVMILCLFAVTTTIFGYARIDTEKTASLTLTFGTGDTAFSNTTFRIYHVANLSDAAGFTLTEDFAAINTSLENMDNAAWQELSKKLSAYVAAEKLVPLEETSTDREGKAAFRDLTVGLYLVTGDVYANGDTVYTPAAFLVTLPGLNAEDQWGYDMIAAVKFEKTTVPKLPQTGQLWWPVPILVIGGVGFVLLGVWSEKRSGKKNGANFLETS